MMITKASQTYAALPDATRQAIADAVFNLMEYGATNPDDGDGPGREWTRDLGEDIGAIFIEAGVVFTTPKEIDTDDATDGITP